MPHEERDITTKIIKGIEEKILKEVADYWEGNNIEVLTPKLTSDYRLLLAAWYEKYSEELGEIEKRYPYDWTKIREDCKSVKESDMRYNQTDDGQRRIVLKFKLKSIEKMIGALKDRMKRLEMESFNRF